MTIELTLLVWSTALILLYLGVQSTLYRMQHGVMHAATPRDNDAPPNVLTGRGARAFSNLLETYPAFVALAVAAALGSPGEALWLWGAVIYLAARVVYLPLYVAGVFGIRSLVWMVSAVGLALMFVSLVF